MHPALARYAFYFPIQAMRMAPVRRRLGELEESQWDPPQQVRALQWTRAKTLLQHAYEHVPFYRARLQEHGILPSSIRSFEDWANVPYLTKEDLRQLGPDLLSARRSKLLLKKTTGGSTGQAVTIWKDGNTTAYQDAAMYRAYRWSGIDIGDRQGRFWGVPINAWARSKSRIIDVLMNRIRLSAFAFDEESMHQYYRALVTVRPKYLYGYVSMLAQFAQFVKQQRLEASQLGIDVIVTTSEVLYESQRALMRDTFQCPVINEYGCGEVGPIACECPAGSMHINADTLLTEFIADGHTASAGNVGEIVVTELNNLSMPLIRYRMADFAHSTRRTCPCGRTLPIVDRIMGRAYDLVTSKDGRHFHGEYFMYMLEDMKEKKLGIRQFQVVQSSRTHFVIKVVREPQFTGAALEYLNRRFRSGFGNDVRLEFEYLEEIPRAPSGKLRLIVSNVA